VSSQQHSASELELLVALRVCECVVCDVWGDELTLSRAEQWLLCSCLCGWISLGPPRSGMPCRRW
jgi:hypothetical protein